MTSVPDAVRVELERLAERWRQLPLDRALAAFPAAHAFAQSLADEAARTLGMPSAHLPDLGPAVVLDQVRVLVHDLVQAGPPGGAADLSERLAVLRRRLA